MRAGSRLRNPDPDGVAIFAAVVVGVLTVGMLPVPVSVPAVAVAGGLALALALALWCWRGTDATAGALVLGLLLLIAATATGVRVVAVGQGILPELAAERARASVEGTVAAEPRRVSFGGRLVTRSVRQVTAAGQTWRTGERATVILAPGADPVAAGDHLHLRGRLTPSERADRLGWSPPVELRDSVLVRHAPSTNPALRVTEEIRVAARDRALESLSSERAGLLVAMALGDRSLLREDREEAFRVSGLVHLVVVSGGNVAVVLGAVLGVALLLGAGRGTLVALGLPAVAAFAVLTRWEPSVLRASVMAALALLGVAGGFAPGGRRAFCLAVAVLLLLNPVLGASLGLALSASATAGLLWVAPLFARLLPEKLPELARGAIGATIGAELGVTPVLAGVLGTVSSVSVAANLLALPLAAAPRLLGVLAAALAPAAPWAAEQVCALAEWPLIGIIWIARTAARASGGELVLTWPARLLWVGGCAVTVVWAARAARGRAPTALDRFASASSSALPSSAKIR